MLAVFVPAQMIHPPSMPNTLPRVASSLCCVQPGVRHIYAWGRRGPWPCTSSRSSPPASDLYGVKQVRPISARATTNVLGPGAILIGPGDRPIVALDASGFQVGRALLVAELKGAGTPMAIAQVNRVRNDSTIADVRMFTSWFGPEALRDTTAHASHRGMTLTELGDLMQRLGVRNASFDGRRIDRAGGSRCNDGEPCGSRTEQECRT